eukprot:275445-Alexandrium_andersonii.AAC.1
MATHATSKLTGATCHVSLMPCPAQTLAGPQQRCRSGGDSLCAPAEHALGLGAMMGSTQETLNQDKQQPTKRISPPDGRSQPLG